MATIFESKRVECKIRSVRAVNDGEIWDAEPYFWPFFYKIDGERSEAQINIDFLSGMEIKLSGRPTVTSKTGSHGNLPRMEDGDFIRVDNSKGRFRDSFDPIPVKVKVNLPSFVEDNIADAILDLEELIGLIDSDRKCPPIDKVNSTELGEYITEFISGTLGGLPGICGGTYILMEEDFTSENAAEECRIGIKSTIKDQLQDVIDDINIRIQYPMDLNGVLKNLTDLLDTEEDIREDATATAFSIFIDDVIANLIRNGLIGAGIGASTGLLVGGPLTWPLILPGAITGFIIGALISADFDDILGVSIGLITHFVSDDLSFDFVPLNNGEASGDGTSGWHGEWRVNSGIRFR